MTDPASSARKVAHLSSEANLRMAPAEPPYGPNEQALLARMMPSSLDAEPIALFRLLILNRVLAERMLPLGALFLGHGSSLSLRHRELAILRVCSLCNCKYEADVHQTLFSRSAGLTAEEIGALASPDAMGIAWPAEDAALLQTLDALHADSRLTERRWRELRSSFDEKQILELMVLAGWYHAISYIANVAGLQAETWSGETISLPGESCE